MQKLYEAYPRDMLDRDVIGLKCLKTFINLQRVFIQRLGWVS